MLKITLIKIFIILMASTSVGVLAEEITGNSVFSFLVGTIITLAGFTAWLVRRILKITEEVTGVTKDVKNAIDNHAKALEKNNETIQNILFETTIKK